MTRSPDDIRRRSRKGRSRVKPNTQQNDKEVPMKLIVNNGGHEDADTKDITEGEAAMTAFVPVPADLNNEDIRG